MATTARGVTLPSGRVFDLLRARSDGPLNPEELEYCARWNIPIGYDPAQLGWVTLLGEDDLPTRHAPAPLPMSTGQDAASDPQLFISQSRERFDAIARPIVEQVKARMISPADAEARLWAGVDLALEDVRFVADLVPFEKCYTVLRSLAARAIGQLRAPAIAGESAEADVAADADASRFTFRAWRLADIALYRRFLDNPKLWAFMPEEYPSPFTEETARLLIEASQVTSHHEVLAVEVDGVPIGQVRLLFDDSYPGLHAAEVSYWIAEEHWGKAFGAKILRIYTHQSFRGRPLDLIYAWIRTEHAASIKTAERAGYRRDPFPRLSSFASEVRRAGWSRWICYRSDSVAVFSTPPPDDQSRRSALSGSTRIARRAGR
jgi:RimJ/RimL family protein N-acetyltransferase